MGTKKNAAVDARDAKTDTKTSWGWKRWSAMVLAAVTFAVGGFAAGALTRIGERAADIMWPEPDIVSEETDPDCLRGPSGRVGEEYVYLSVSPHKEDCWSATVTDIEPGDMVDVAIIWRNNTEETVEDVTLRAYLPEDLLLVPSTTEYQISGMAEPRPAPSDTVATEGINFGDLESKAQAWVTFTVQIDADTDLVCGLSILGIYGQSAYSAPPYNDWQPAGITFNRSC